MTEGGVSAAPLESFDQAHADWIGNEKSKISHSLKARGVKKAIDAMSPKGYL